MDEYNPRGETMSNADVAVDLTHSGVRSHTGTCDLMPCNNPHTVPGWFARQLVHAGRARYAAQRAPGAPVEVVSRDPLSGSDVVHADPVVTPVAAPRRKQK